MATKVAESGANHIVHALQSALRHGALPGENEGFDEGACEEAAKFLGRAIHLRLTGDPVISLETLAGPEGQRLMRLAIINDDMPFLVDSVAGTLSARGLAIHRLIHPVVRVARDEQGVLTDILPPDSSGARRESIIYFEADRADARQRHALIEDVRTTLSHVRAAVTDWPAMQQALLHDADATHDNEGAALLRWFHDRNLTQLGHEIRKRDGEAEAQIGICAVAGEPMLSPSSVESAFTWFEEGKPSPLIVKSNRISCVHRRVLIDLVILPVREGGKLVALSIHAGLWTSSALSAPPEKVPLLRSALATMMEKFGFDPSGHAGKALSHTLTGLPHDLLIGFSSKALEHVALTAMSLSDRPRPKMAVVKSSLGRHLFAFVWLPRDDVSTGRRVAIEDMLVDAAHARLLSWSIALEDGGLALIRYVLDLREGGRMPDTDTLNRRLEEMVRGWAPAVENSLAEMGEHSRAIALAARYAASFPAAYRVGAGPREAAVDILQIHGLTNARSRSARLYRNREDAPTRLRLKLYSVDSIVLSEAVPALENFGFRVIEEMSTPLGDGTLGHIQKFILDLAPGLDGAQVIERADTVQQAIANVLEGAAENDRFNELIIAAALDPRAIILFRSIFRYLRQTGVAYGLATFVDALRREHPIARNLVELFEARHDPARGSKGPSDAAKADKAIDAGLEGVSAIDEDRMLRLVRAVMMATLRTNFYAPAAEEALAFKLDSAQVPGLPAPLPWREIWVYSPRVEGIHLRAGPVARGGLRWSDRRDDFRTEVLGLMKAQRVKNAVIVPTGAKGGFFPKMLPDSALDRDAWLAEGTESYRIFIRTLLSVTDNLVDGKVVHPQSVVIHDGEDPYFVVAADKGTATFSDVANAIALDRDFWLGDAFASGGSHGYDHKAMGITAKGAWVSVQRHFLEMGVDVQKEPVRVIGCGDMSGDVFGNGMLLSKAIKLVAAFDHRHIFIDPDPHPAASWKERQRMFNLPRSSWDDYDKSLISKGGGVFPRSQKSIPLSLQMKALLDVSDDEMEPAQLLSAILKSPADLLWFGGIGTYVKAAAQNHIEVGDPANDRLRVDAEDLRVKVVGEGANLGVTQAARIAYALHGGRINTDFIDNSAGVDCSDNEVNIKIALNKEMRADQLAFADRNTLLVSMTDSVADIVLEDNRLQALGLSIAQAGGVASLPSYVRLIEIFETSGRLNRRVEGLAGNEELLRRIPDGHGLTRPELAILLSTAKLALQDAIEQNGIAQDPTMAGELTAAFPPAMQAGHATAIAEHPLRCEIIATKLANRIVNRLGIIHPFELAEEEGCSLADMACAFVMAERLFHVSDLWKDIDESPMSESARLGLFNEIAGAMRAQIADLIRSLSSGTLPGEGVALLHPGVSRLADVVDSLLRPETIHRADAIAANLAAIGAPDHLIDRAVGLFKLDGAVGLSCLAYRLEVRETDVTKAFTRLGETLGIDWVQSTAARMQPSDPWERLLVAGVARDLQQIRFEFLGEAKGKDISAYVDSWLKAKERRVQQFQALVKRARAAASPNAAMLAELTGQARGLLAK
ncbi:NAD-glutamate dehydrogenase [Rhizorhapis sp. SPR117]|uniref:NAD-glutamate dehydrogenase n=1 Tax=Rhizorhapis sp. SPR117 TaxID=2912611 RepID=UPI001F17724F|nr:NAD-glutamate dehydrogenase [Rhizorhapis sp. SPR117]